MRQAILTLVGAVAACVSMEAQHGGHDAGAAAGGAGTAGGLAGGGAAGGDAGGVAGGAAGGAVMSMYPTWQLTDVQPQSPRFNQTYGLSAFQGRPLVAVLLQGF